MEKFVGLSLVIILGLILISPSLACIRSLYDGDELYANSREDIFIDPEKNEMLVSISDIFLIQKGIHRHENITSCHSFWLKSLQVDNIIDKIYNYSCFGIINQTDELEKIPCRIENDFIIVNTTLNKYNWNSEKYALKIEINYSVKDIGIAYPLEEEKPFTPEAYVTQLKFCDNMPSQTEIRIDRKYTPSYVPKECNFHYSKNQFDGWYITCEKVKLVTIVLKKPFPAWCNVIFWVFIGIIISWFLSIITKSKTINSELTI